MTELDRRSFLRGAAASVVGGAALAGPFQGLVARAAAAGSLEHTSLGPLQPAADLRDGVVRLALPNGFSYRSFGATGDDMSDGVATPSFPDGMAAFGATGRTVRIVRNHEVRGEAGAIGDPSRAYDPRTQGGATTLVVDRRTRELIGSWVSLNGTGVNCAGGATPWGTWISAEETVNGPDLGPDFAGNGPTSAERHGYLFEVDPAWGPGAHPRVLPVRHAGRFAHEGVAYHRRTGALYQTEDNFEFPSGIYRYVPPADPMAAKRLADGGALQMLKVVGADRAQLGIGQSVGATYDVEWVAIPDPDWSLPDGTDNDTGIQEVGRQGFEQGAAEFARPEGIWEHHGLIYFSCTRGGATRLSGNPFGEYGNGFGQVWVLDPSAGRLTLLFQSPGPEVLDMPDNLTVSARGNVILCEDGPIDNFLRGLTPDGELFDFARNAIAGAERQEFAGVCFSPDNQTLFVNIQYAQGLTFAIWRTHGGTFL